MDFSLTLLAAAAVLTPGKLIKKRNQGSQKKRVKRQQMGMQKCNEQRVKKPIRGSKLFGWIRSGELRPEKGLGK